MREDLWRAVCIDDGQAPNQHTVTRIQINNDSKKLTVVKVVEEGRVGGPQMDILRTSKALRSSDIDVIVVVPRADSDKFQGLLKVSGISNYTAKLTRPSRQVRQLIRYLANFVIEVNELGRLFRSVDPDLIHAGGGAWQIKAVLAARICRIPVIWHLNDTQTPWPIRKTFQLLKHIPIGFICAGKCVQKYYFPKASQPNTVVIQSPIDCSEFSPRIAPAVPTEDLRDGDKPPLVLTVGNIGRVKGVEVFISAINRVKTHRAVRAQVLGARLTGQEEYMSQIQHLIQNFRLDQTVQIFMPANVAANLREATVYVCASWSEASPTAVWEAMATGLPVISTDVGDVSRFIKDGETGFVVQPGADNLIAEKIMWVLDNPHHAKEMGRRARTVALANFHHVKVARLHESFYQELLKSPACS